jgi:hypothetical protein
LAYEMPMNQSLWALGETARPLRVGRLESEKALEDMIIENPAVLNSSWMVVGRQVRTDFNGYIDILALQPDGSPVVIELKRDKTPRDVTAQLLDYASWIENVSPEKLSLIYNDFKNGANLQEDFEARFGSEWDDESLSSNHQLVLVASELDSASERIVSYLAEKGLNINVFFFQVFDDGDRQYLARSWLVDPAETQANVSSPREKGVWNGEFYANFGVSDTSRWEDGIKYGFITAAGGSWYTQTLQMLEVGDRVWVQVPKTGYVGVGTVRSEAQSVTDFLVTENGQDVPLVSANTLGDYLANGTDEDSSWFVGIDWLHTVPVNRAVREVGFFGNQNSVAKPKSEKWEHTVARLRQLWEI